MELSFNHDAIYYFCLNILVNDVLRCLLKYVKESDFIYVYANLRSNGHLEIIIYKYFGNINN